MEIVLSIKRERVDDVQRVLSAIPRCYMSGCILREKYRKFLSAKGTNKAK